MPNATQKRFVEQQIYSCNLFHNCNSSK